MSRTLPMSPFLASMHGSKWSKQTSASGSNTTSRTTLTSALLILLLPLLPLAQVLGSLLESLHPLEESLGEDVARFSDLHHVVAWMFSCSMTGLTQVKVIADNTFVPVANNWLALASITSDSVVNSRR